MATIALTRVTRHVIGAYAVMQINREGRKMAVDPRGQDLKRYIEQDPGGPVVMLNLLKYRAGGEQSYRAYSAALKDYLPNIGAEVLYVGDCSTVLVAPAGWDWDAVLIVRYPSRQAFSEMVRDPAYQAVTHLRTEALTEAVLQATVPWQTVP
jgi:uncharacterized protein (DUF1330 family)